jgi:hypothetical protein
MHDLLGFLGQNRVGPTIHTFIPACVVPKWRCPAFTRAQADNENALLSLFLVLFFFYAAGGMSARWPNHQPAPYYRLIMHIDRLWDYCSCPEAQLKTWLAKHLIAAANPGCNMWDSTAAADAAPGADGWSEGDRAAAAAAGLQPLGPYSCSLADAGERNVF